MESESTYMTEGFSRLGRHVTGETSHCLFSEPQPMNLSTNWEINHTKKSIKRDHMIRISLSISLSLSNSTTIFHSLPRYHVTEERNYRQIMFQILWFVCTQNFFLPRRISRDGSVMRFRAAQKYCKGGISSSTAYFARTAVTNNATAKKTI